MAEAQRHISSREFAEWAAFYNLEPWGYEMDNWRTALITSMVANTARDPKKRPRPYMPDDFMPGVETKAITADELKVKASAIFSALGGTKPGPDGTPVKRGKVDG